MTAKIEGKNQAATRATSLAAGTTKHYSKPNQQLTIGGVSYTVSQVNANLQEIGTLRAATVSAQSSAKAKVAAETAQLPPLLLFMSAYVAFVRATFGNQPDVLADFGIPPKKARTPMTTEQKAASKAKAEATREARGTKGPKAKLDITGNVTGVVVTPVTAPAAPAPSPSPAPAAPAPATVPATGVASGTAANGSATPHS